MYCY
jgi:CBS domain-containing protein